MFFAFFGELSLGPAHRFGFSSGNSYISTTIAKLRKNFRIALACSSDEHERPTTFSRAIFLAGYDPSPIFWNACRSGHLAHLKNQNWNYRPILLFSIFLKSGNAPASTRLQNKTKSSFRLKFWQYLSTRTFYKIVYFSCLSHVKAPPRGGTKYSIWLTLHIKSFRPQSLKHHLEILVHQVVV